MSQGAHAVHVEVSQKVAALAPSVRDAVVDTLVNQEQKRRTDLVVSALSRLTDYHKELQKIKPDQVTYTLVVDDQGQEKQVPNEQWSKQKLEERKKAQEKFDNLTAALNKALDNGDYKKLEELMAK